MPTRNRLSHEELAAQPSQGVRRIHGDYASLTVIPLPERRRAGCACIISKKTAVHATARNALRRRVRVALAPLVANDMRPVGLIFTMKRSALDASLAELRLDIERLLMKTADVAR